MICYRKCYRYQLTANYECVVGICPDCVIDTDFIRLTRSGSLHVRKGYAWNGPANLVTGAMEGSLVNDVFCQLIRQGYLDCESNVKSGIHFLQGERCEN